MYGASTCSTILSVFLLFLFFSFQSEPMENYWFSLTLATAASFTAIYPSLRHDSSENEKFGLQFLGLCRLSQWGIMCCMLSMLHSALMNSTNAQICVSPVRVCDSLVFLFFL